MDESNICQYQYKNNPKKKCPHPPLPGEKYCIFHIEKDGKNLEDLKRYIDLYRTTYPDMALDLEEAYLANAELNTADLSGAILQNAILFGANLESAILDNADLSGANLVNAHLVNASLVGVILRNADLSSANLSSADLSGSDLSKAKLHDTNLSGAILEDAILDNVDSNNVKFVNSTLSYSRLRESKILNADFSDGEMYGILAEHTDFTGSKFVKTTLNSAVLENCILKNVIMDDVSASGSSFRFSQIVESHLSNSDFSNSLFTKVSFDNSVLKSLDFSNSDLSETSLYNTTFYEVIVSDARFYNSNFELSDFSGTNIARAGVDILATLSSKYVFLDPSQIIPLPEETRGNMSIKTDNYFEALKEFDRARAIYAQIKEYYKNRGYYTLMDTYFVRENIMLERIYQILFRILLKNPGKIYDDSHNDISHSGHLIRTYLTPSFMNMSRVLKSSKIRKIFENKVMFWVFGFIYTMWQLVWRKFIKWTSNYGTSIGRIFGWFILIIFGFSLGYLYWDIPGYYNLKGNWVAIHNFWDALYFSIVTFTTLGYGDYAPHNYKLVAASEALLGAFFISYFVVVVVRKILR